MANHLNIFMISFKNWLSEGKGIDLGNDASKFVEEAYAKLLQEYKNKQKWNVNLPFEDFQDIPTEYFKSEESKQSLLYVGQIANKYASKTISVYVFWNEDQQFCSYPQDNAIVIVLSWRNNFPPDMKTILWHELTHNFDPKLTRLGWDKMNKWRKNSQFDDSEEGYRIIPTEEDANIVAQAKYRITKIKSLSQLSNIKPINMEEKEWYTKPNVWKKYLNTLYNIFQQKLQQDKNG